MKSANFSQLNEQSEDLFSSGEVTDEDSQALTEEEIAAQKAPMEELSPILVVEDPFSTILRDFGEKPFLWKQSAFTV